MADTDIDTNEPDREKAPEGVSASAAADGRRTIFVKHPVEPKIKQAMVRQSLRILDSQFAPNGAPIYDGRTGKVIGGGAKDNKGNKGKADA